jgi:hypothetical protein
MERQLIAYESVKLSYEDVVRFLERSPTAVLQPATEAASDHAHEVVSTLSVPLGNFRLSRDVTVVVGDLERSGSHRAKLPMSWRASQHQGLFPAMTATLGIAALSEEEPRTELSMAGSYVPPAGIIGGIGDNLSVLHRLAETSVQRLLRDIAERLVAELAR